MDSAGSIIKESSGPWRRVASMKVPWGALIPICIAAVYVLSFRFNGFLDLPNHLARATILLECTSALSAPICQEFTINLTPVPFMLADMSIMVWLALAPPLLAEKLAALTAIVVMIGGWYLLYRRVRGAVNAGYWAGLVLVLSNFLYNGFYAFVLSIALSMYWMAYWWGVRDDRTAKNQCILVGGMACIFGVHLAGMLVVMLVYNLYDVHRYLIGERSWSAWFRSVGRSWPVNVAFLALYGFQQAATHGSSGGVIHYKPIFAKAVTALYPFVNFSPAVDVGVALLLTLVVVAACRGRASTIMSDYWAFVGVAFMAAFALTPTEAFGVYDFDVRFLLTAYFSLFLAVGGSMRSGRRYVGVVTLILLGSLAVQCWHKYRLQPRLAAVYEAMESIPADARLMQVNSVSEYPSGSGSRVNPFPYVRGYHVATGHGSVGGLFDCRFNPNLAYFCYRSAEAIPADAYRFDFQGISSLTEEDVNLLRTNYDYLLVTFSPEQEAVDLNLIHALPFDPILTATGVILLGNRDSGSSSRSGGT